MKEQQMNAAADALDCSLDRLAEKYMLTPLELLSVIARNLDKRLKAEALDERMAVTTMQNIMNADDMAYPGPETESTMEAIRRGAADFSSLDLPCHVCGKMKGQPPERCNGHYIETSNPTCCRKHNMMGKTTGNCAGGPVVTKTVGAAVLSEVANGTGPEYQDTPGGTDGGAY